MKLDNNVSPALLSATQTARFLAISERMLWTLTNEKQIPHIRIGRLVRYSISDLNAWIESKRNEGRCV